MSIEIKGKARNGYKLTPIGKLITHGWDMVEGCWIYKGPKTSRGYGKLGHQGKTLSAHRTMYEASKGEIEEGLVVRHTCDTPSCINPLHLVVGTHQDNANDKVVRHRHRYKAGHPGAKLTEEDVSEIRNMLSSGEYIQKDIAKRFSVSAGTISYI